jgi:hypothetical protein
MRGLRVVQLALTFLVLGALLGCRPARGPQGGPAAGAVAGLSRTYQGQPRLLVGVAERSKISHERGDALARGGCDVAVLVTSALLKGGTARFTMEPIGIPRIEQQPSSRKCAKPPREYTLVVSRLDASASFASMSEEIDRVLKTPETYLADHGVAFAPKAGAKRGPVADKQLKAKPEERMLARTITVPHQRLLSVAPIRRDDRKRVQYAGEIEFEAVIGVNGGLYAVQLPGSFAAQADRIQKAMELWRYQPARIGEQPVAFRIGQERTVFTVF